MVTKTNFQGLDIALPGFGCMGMSGWYGQTNDETSKQVIREAIKSGVNFFDTSDLYGLGHNEKLLGEVLAEGDNRSKVILCTKFGFIWNEKMELTGEIRGDKEWVRKALNDSIERLGTKPDVYYQHRVDPNTPIEETVAEMEALKKEGMFKHIGLSECSAETLRKAAKVAKISFVQMEFSPWTTEIETDGVVDACKELGITVVAYSPLGRGFLTGQYHSPEDFDSDDLRRSLPRFSAENFPKNLKIVDELRAIADKKGCTVGQLTIAWVAAQGYIPIPGTKKMEYMKENFAANEVKLTEEELKAIRAVVDQAKVETSGNRYTDQFMSQVGL